MIREEGKKGPDGTDQYMGLNRCWNKVLLVERPWGPRLPADLPGAPLAFVWPRAALALVGSILGSVLPNRARSSSFQVGSRIESGTDAGVTNGTVVFAQIDQIISDVALWSLVACSPAR